MKLSRILFVLAAAILLLTACDIETPTAEPPIVEQPQEPAPTPVPPTATPTKPAPSPEPQYAPFCEVTAPAGCEAPVVEMLDNKYCIEKVPYAIMAVQAGTTYQSLDPDLDCVDQLHNDGSLRVTCHSLTSKQLWSYDIKVCNSACSAPVLQMETGQCPDGYGYDPTNMCCAAPSPASVDGCTIYTVDLGGCPQ